MAVSAQNTARVITRGIPPSTEEGPANADDFVEPPKLKTDELLPPPGQSTNKESAVKKEADDKLKWDYSKLLSSGTLGSLVANIHTGLATATEYPGWALDDKEEEQYDNTLGMILEPLLQRVEYLPLVLGILSLATIESFKVIGYLKWKKGKEKAKEEQPKTEEVKPVTEHKVVPQQPVAQPVQQPPQEDPNRLAVRAVEQELGLPPLPSERRNAVPDLGLPPGGPQ